MAYNDWLSINPTTGSGDGQINVTVSSHSGYADRSKTVTITGSVNNVIKTTSIPYVQSGVVIPGTVGRSNAKGETHTPITNTATMTANDYNKLEGELAFRITNTNAQNIKLNASITGANMVASNVFDVVLSPLTVTNVNGTNETFNTLTSTTSAKPNSTMTVYSMTPEFTGKQYGRVQVIPGIEIRLKKPAQGFVNNSSQTVTAVYSLQLLTGASGIPTEEVAEHQFKFEFAPKTSFSASDSRGLDLPTSGGSRRIEVVSPSDVTWTATLS